MTEPVHRAIFVVLGINLVGSFHVLTQHEPAYFVLTGGMGLAVDFGADAVWIPIAALAPVFVTDRKWARVLAWATLAVWILAGPFYFFGRFIT